MTAATFRVPVCPLLFSLSLSALGATCSLGGSPSISPLGHYVYAVSLAACASARSRVSTPAAAAVGRSAKHKQVWVRVASAVCRTESYCPSSCLHFISLGLPVGGRPRAACAALGRCARAAREPIALLGRRPRSRDVQSVVCHLAECAPRLKLSQGVGGPHWHLAQSPRERDVCPRSPGLFSRRCFGASAFGVWACLALRCMPF